MVKDKKVTVVIPAYNEEKVIGKVLKRIGELYPDFEVLVVNDGSTDETAKVAIKEGAYVYSLPYNIGNGAAVKTGIRYASGDIIVLMDGDGQHKPEDIERLLEFMPEYDMVVGARTRGSKRRRHRNLANWVYNILASYVTGFKIEDLTSGFRAIKREVVSKFLYLFPNTYSYPSTLTLSVLRSGRSLKYVPIKTADRVGKSKLKLFRDGVRFLMIIIKIATLYSPLRILLPISVALFILGIGYYVYTFVTQHRFTNMSALILSTSLMIFVLGLISEQIAQMRFERSEED